jgi:hypothetical protein
MTTTTTPSEVQIEPTIVVDDDPDIIDSRSVPLNHGAVSTVTRTRCGSFRTGFTRCHRRTRHRG